MTSSLPAYVSLRILNIFSAIEQLHATLLLSHKHILSLSFTIQVVFQD